MVNAHPMMVLALVLPEFCLIRSAVSISHLLTPSIQEAGGYSQITEQSCFYCLPERLRLINLQQSEALVSKRRLIFLPI